MSSSSTMLLPLGSMPRSPASRTLETSVRQIEAQKGSFRTVTERSLQQDIDKEEHDTVEINSEIDDEADEDEDSRETKQKKLWEAREEMMKQLFRAQNETLTALDSISLLLSGITKTRATAKTSMSPALSAVVPEATLEAQKVRVAEEPSLTQQRNESLYLGYKIHGLESAIETLSAARTRLGNEAHRESAFWKQVASLSAEGFVISRLPTDSRIVGVHFGFPEAAPAFRNRGFAVLKTNQAGDLELDQAASASKRRCIAVSMFEKGKVTSRSKIPPITGSTASLATVVAELRRSLFDEELFFEVMREARAIANQGVRVTSSTIIADINANERIQIELFDQDSQAAETQVEEDGTAEAIVFSLRGLLSKGHEQRLARRSQPPPALLPKPTPIPEYALLRPLLSHTRHHRIVSALQKFLESFQVAMTNAGLKWETTISTNYPSEPLSKKSLSHTLFLDTLLASAETKFNFVLPTGRSMELKIRTHLAPPTFGTSFTASSLRFGKGVLTPANLSSLDMVKSNIIEVLEMDTLQLIELKTALDGDASPGWALDEQHYDRLNLGDATLHVKIDRGGVGLRYLDHKGAALRTDGSLWVWDVNGFSESTGGKREVKESRHLLDIVQEITAGL